MTIYKFKLRRMIVRGYLEKLKSDHPDEPDHEAIRALEAKLQDLEKG